MDDCEALRKELDEWKADHARLSEENAELRLALELKEDVAKESLGGIGEVAAKYQREREGWKRRALRLEERYFQLELIIDPQRYVDTDNLAQMSAEELAQSNYSKTTTAEPGVNAAFMVVCRVFSNDVNYHFKEGGGKYFGTVEELMKEASRFSNILWRSPMPEDLRGPFLKDFGITKEQQLAAIQALSVFWHDDLLREQYQQQLDNIFDSMIEPYLNQQRNDKVQREQKNTARELFRKSATATSKEQGLNRGTRVAPALLSGRHKKSD